MELGADQELIIALRTGTGDAWGGLGLYREPGAAMFDRDEIDFTRAIAPLLADGARRALLLGEAADPEGPEAPGLLVLSSIGSSSRRPPASRSGYRPARGRWDAGRLPSVVLAVAGRALRSAEGARRARRGRPRVYDADTLRSIANEALAIRQSISTIKSRPENLASVTRTELDELLSFYGEAVGRNVDEKTNSQIHRLGRHAADALASGTSASIEDARVSLRQLRQTIHAELCRKSGVPRFNVLVSL